MQNGIQGMFALVGLLLTVALGAEPLRVGVSVLPLESVVSEIGGPEIAARSLQQEGDSCSVFEPRPSSIAWLSQAKLFFRTGAGYESVIMDKLASQFSKIQMVDLREAVTPIQAAPGAHDHAPHHHHDGHACAACGSTADGAVDPHIWMDPRRLGQIASVIESRLSELVPGDAALIAARAERFRQRTSALDARLEALLSPYKGRAFFIFHPALGYFADRYGLEQVAVSPGGHSLTAKELHSRIRQAREAGVRVIFVQPQESRDHAETIARAVGARLVEINPMARDWEANLLQVGEALVAGFAEE